jgi:CRISPR-associated protein Cas2
MPKSGYYAAVYDISDNRERTKVSKVLGGYGTRVQESVFECRCTRGGLDRILKDLDALDLKTGFVFLYRIHDTAKRLAAGKIPENLISDEPYAFII